MGKSLFKAEKRMGMEWGYVYIYILCIHMFYIYIGYIYIYVMNEYIYIYIYISVSMYVCRYETYLGVQLGKLGRRMVLAFS